MRNPQFINNIIQKYRQHKDDRPKYKIEDLYIKEEIKISLSLLAVPLPQEITSTAYLAINFFNTTFASSTIVFLLIVPFEMRSRLR